MYGRSRLGGVQQLLPSRTQHEACGRCATPPWTTCIGHNEGNARKTAAHIAQGVDHRVDLWIAPGLDHDSITYAPIESGRGDGVQQRASIGDR